MTNGTTPTENGPADDTAVTAAITTDTTTEAAAEPAALAPIKPASWDDLSLHQDVKLALDDMGYFTPTAVQTAVFHPVSEGKDLLVQSRTGTGKTTAFGLPLVNKIVPAVRQPQAMILCPTRELALQVARELALLGKHRGIIIEALYGGAPIGKQIEALKNGVHIIVGTPGRVLDHISRRTLDCKTISTFVLDECDEMLSMGFLEDIERVTSNLPEKHQTLLFSATMPVEVERYAKRHMKGAENLSLSRDSTTVSDIHHAYYIVSGIARSRDLLKILYAENPESAIIFCNMRDETTMLSRFLKKQGLDAEPLSSDLSQADRERVMGRMKAKSLRFLCATDVAARGIDISNLSHVINFSVPESPEVYVHRTGRTGRAGKKGVALSMVGPRELGNFRFIRLQFGIKPEERVLPKDDIFIGTPAASLPPIGKQLPPDPVDILIRAVPQTPSDLELGILEKMLKKAQGRRVLAQLLGEKLNAITTRTSGPQRPRREENHAGDERSFAERPERGERGDRGPRPEGGGGGRFDRDRGPRDRGGPREDRPRFGDRGPATGRTEGDAAPVEAGAAGAAGAPVAGAEIAPRAEGVREDRPRFDRDRGPRPEGDRGRGPREDRPRFGGDDRGPRPEGDRGPRPEGDRGPRPEGDRGPREDRPRFNDRDRGPRPEGDRPRFDRGPREDRGPRQEHRNDPVATPTAPLDAAATEVAAPAVALDASHVTEAAPATEQRHEGDRDRGGRDRDRGRDRGGRDRDRGGRDRDRSLGDRNRDDRPASQASNGTSNHVNGEQAAAPATEPAAEAPVVAASEPTKVDDVAKAALERGGKPSRDKKKSEPTEATREFWETWADNKSPAPAPVEAKAAAPASEATAEGDEPKRGRSRGGRGRGRDKKEAVAVTDEAPAPAKASSRSAKVEAPAKAEAPKAETETAPAGRAKRDTVVNVADGSQARLFVSLGKKHGVSADDLRSLLAGPIGGDTARIGSVSMRDSHAHVRVPEDLVEQIISGVHGTSHKDQDVTVERSRA